MAPFGALWCGRRERSRTLAKDQGGILVTEELNDAIQRCRSKVQRLGEECRRSKRKYRDLEFDLLEDRDRCLYGLNQLGPRTNAPADVRRIPDIVDNPQFIVKGATPSDISQGSLDDCWFLSALAVIATAGLIENICVERDEEMGIYGFIFWRDSGWAEVVIDDLLCTKVRPWEALEQNERDFYCNDRRNYNKTARKGLIKNLCFAKSRTNNETWVPLIEKAYAKLHGDYESLNFGFTSEGVEDLTGGVSTLMYRGDIPSVDEFWKDELSKVGKTRLFACFTPGSLPGQADRRLRGAGATEVEGLITGHAYSVIKAIEYVGPGGKPRRFLKLRNPWGKKEWSGPWSDGSEEWNEEWTDGLKKALDNYGFGDDGEFVQEYEDFLDSWGIIERSRLFEGDWIMSSQWLQLPSDAHLRPWSHGEVSFTIDIVGLAGDTSASETIIVLAQRDTRYFEELSGPYLWSLDFLLYNKGPQHHDKYPIARSVHSTMWNRSVKLEIDLQPGQYVVHARLDCKHKDEERSTGPRDWRKERRKFMEMMKSAMVAANLQNDSLMFQNLPVPPSSLAGQDLSEMESCANLHELRDWSNSSSSSSSYPQSSRRSTSTLETPSDAVSPATLQRYRGSTFDSTPRPLTVQIHPEAPPSIMESPRQMSAHLDTSRPAANGGPRRESTGVPGLPGRWNFSMSREEPQERQNSSLSNAGPRTPAEEPPVNAPSGGYTWAEVSQILSRWKGPSEKHEGFFCRECHPRKEIEGPMIRCLGALCYNCYLCYPCMLLHQEHHGHRLIVSIFKDDDDALFSQHDPGRVDADTASNLVLGLRVYTRSGRKATVEGQLRTGSILRNHIFNPRPAPVPQAVEVLNSPMP